MINESGILSNETTNNTQQQCVICRDGLCKYGAVCCKCNDYDYIIGCSYCSVASELRDPLLDSESKMKFDSAMRNAQLLRTKSTRRSSVRTVPPIELPKLSPDFLMAWSQSPTSPLRNSQRSSQRTKSSSSEAETSE